MRLPCICAEDSLRYAYNNERHGKNLFFSNEISRLFLSLRLQRQEPEITGVTTEENKADENWEICIDSGRGADQPPSGLMNKKKNNGK